MTARRRMISCSGPVCSPACGDLSPGILRRLVVAEATRYQVLAREQRRKANVALAQPSTAEVLWLCPQQGRAAGGGWRWSAESMSRVLGDGCPKGLARTLRIAAGHIPGTALQPNVAIAAHRETFFRRLGPQSGDLIRIYGSSPTSTVSGSPMSSVPTIGFWSLPRISC